MADRWSNPSGGLGLTNRWRVWPSGSDSYAHTDLANNWDTLDAIIGVPSSGDWPPTRGIDSGIYKEITLLKAEREDIGSVKAFYRPTTGYPLPDGWVPLDGRTLSPSEHDFIGISGSVVLADMRNAIILGADAGLANGTAAAAVGSGNIDNHNGAPGPLATGGSNQHTLVLAEIPSHNHGGGAHSHTFARQQIQLPSSPNPLYLINVRDQITHHETTDSSGTIITSQGSDSAHENRQRWVGMIWIVKVKFIDSI